MLHLMKVLVCCLVVCLFPVVSMVSAAIEVPSVKVDKTPILDGVVQDAAWKSIKPLVIADSASGKRILLRSVYTADQVFFLVQFPDAAQNFLHKPWVWNAAAKKYETGSAREDTFVFKWNMMDKDVDLSSFSDDNYRADVWYWKANRTNPAGFADDKTQVLGDSPAKKSKEKISATGKKRHLSRISDAGKGPYNKYQPKAYEGDLIDAFPVGAPDGSRADVHAKGVWGGGFQTIEFARALNTGHDDDVQFDPASGKAYLFGVSIFSLYGNPLDKSTSNLYGMGRISEPLKLKFQ
ncbi:MAG: hypothetical protein KAU27_14715 [Desulfuromonadales bacterium]|nr:hypothetical protein [Desulfuromonadales bacterium]